MRISSWSRTKTKAVFLTILAGVLWGTSFPAIKIGLNNMDTYLFVFLRFLLASVLMMTIMVVAKKFTFPAKQKRLLLFLGLTNGIAYLLQYVGMTSTTAAKAALFINLSAIWVALLSPKLLGERLGQRKILGVVAALIGVVFVTTNLDFSVMSEGQLIGDLLLIISGVVWAVFMIYNKTLVMTGSGVLQSLTWILPGTLLPMLFFIFPSIGQVATVSAQSWLVIVYTAVVCWIIPYYLWLEGLKHISASTSTILLLTEILIASIISALFLGEVLTFVSIVGAVFIVVAIVLVSFHKD
jgi:drug/metabolite transporter (DMT)-like permease